MDPEIYVYIINKCIQFYKKEIANTDFFDGVTTEDLGSTSNQMEFFNLELEKYKNLGDDFRTLYESNDKKYAITKNSEHFLSSDSLLSLLIEMYNLEYERSNDIFDIIIVR